MNDMAPLLGTSVLSIQEYVSFAIENKAPSRNRMVKGGRGAKQARSALFDVPDFLVGPAVPGKWSEGELFLSQPLIIAVAAVPPRDVDMPRLGDNVVERSGKIHPSRRLFDRLECPEFEFPMGKRFRASPVPA
jgi:hypothetical protein